jgi:3-oxoacyl-[acyl-carrier protein] reductase
LATLEETSLTLWNRTLGVNLAGPLLLTQLASAHMIRQGWGRIVNIASTSGLRAGINRTAYGTSKTALIGLTRQVAVELARYGITANAVAPGPIATEMSEGSHSSAMKAAYERGIPMARYGEADEVAAAVEFFCSESARYITGQVLAVDGGFVAAGNLSA